MTMRLNIAFLTTLQGVIQREVWTFASSVSDCVSWTQLYSTVSSATNSNIQETAFLTQDQCGESCKWNSRNSRYEEKASQLFRCNCWLLVCNGWF